jgi:RNA polymerase sporulation-specific sigma factor
LKCDKHPEGIIVTLELFLATALYFLQGLVFFAGYISNNTFPQPLSEEDEAFFLQRMKKGDEEARNILIEHNLRLVAHIIKKFDSTGEDPDDLISIGTIGLIKAINTFNSEKGTKLATYAARCIENEILITRKGGNNRKLASAFPRFSA